MNTRLQVEHPVTEMITGFDLVEWQLRVAAGEPLPAQQDAIRVDGHAIEVRIYAEDPERDFAPSIGRLAQFRTPEPAANVRVDTGFATGDVVSVHYDAMLAKLICHGATRDEALRTLRRALAETDVVGVASNLDLLGRIAAHAEFAAGAVDTGFIARHADTLLAPQREPSIEVLAAAALCVLTGEADEASQCRGVERRSALAVVLARPLVVECRLRARASIHRGRNVDAGESGPRRPGLAVDRERSSRRGQGDTRPGRPLGHGAGRHP